MSWFNASKGVLAFLAWLITLENFVRTFCHLRRMCVELFILLVSSVHFGEAKIIRSRLLSVPHHFHGLFPPVINAVINVSSNNIIARIRLASSALPRYKRSITAARN
jgi:hypothetical protein